MAHFFRCQMHNECPNLMPTNSQSSSVECNSSSHSRSVAPKAITPLQAGMRPEKELSTNLSYSAWAIARFMYSLMIKWVTISDLHRFTFSVVTNEKLSHLLQS